MQPAIVMPIHDPEGLVLPHLRAVIEPLKDLFDRAFISLTAPTKKAQAAYSRWLESEGFFRVGAAQAGVPIGAQFRSLYARAAASCDPEQVLHLCFADRVVYVLQSGHRQTFIADLRRARDAAPLLYQRSEVAWRTHPRNYWEIEHMATRAGEMVLGKRLDLTWCHLAVRAGQLGKVLAHVRNPDLGMLAEIVLGLDGEVRTLDVDWLAWEDPFICGMDAEALRAEREGSVAETQKRLAYVSAVLQLLAVREPSRAAEPGGRGGR